MAQDDPLQDQDPDLDTTDDEPGQDGEDSTLPADDTFADLNDIPPTQDLQAQEAPPERRPRRNDPEKRINKLVSQNKALADELAAERQARTAAERKAQEFEQSQAERSALDLEGKLADIRAKRKNAFNEGDLDTYDDLNDEYVKAQIALDRIKERQPKQDESGRPPSDTRPVSQDPRSDQPQYPKATMDWVQRNQSWWNADPSNQTRVQQANDTFVALQEEGFDPGSDDFYAELDYRLGQPSRAARPVTSAPRNGREQSSRRQAGITQQDIKSMKVWGYDPNKPEDRKRWLNRNTEL